MKMLKKFFIVIILMTSLFFIYRNVITTNYDFMNILSYDLVNLISLSISYIVVFCIMVIVRNKRKPIGKEMYVSNDITKDLNSLEVGYIYKGYSNSRDVTSLYLQWAQKGYIQLEYIESQKTIVFHKLTEIPSDAKDYERELFNETFSLRNDVRIKMLGTLYGKTIRKTIKRMKNTFKKADKKIYSTELEDLLLAVICSFPMVFVIGAQVFINTKSLTNVLMIASIYVVTISVFTLFMMNIGRSKLSKIILLVCLILFASILMYQSYSSYGVYVTIDIIGIASIVSVMLMYIVSTNNLRSEYGDYVIDQVHNLKKNICEEKIDEIMYKQKEKLLPYAYALQVELEILEYIDELSWFKLEKPISENFLIATDILANHIFQLYMEKNYVR